MARRSYNHLILGNAWDSAEAGGVQDNDTRLAYLAVTKPMKHRIQPTPKKIQGFDGLGFNPLVTIRPSGLDVINGSFYSGLMSLDMQPKRKDVS